MKVLILPDAHLKIELLTRVSELLDQHFDWHCVSLGDWCDDWGRPVEDYQQFFDAFVSFVSHYRIRLYLVWGNHDYGYWNYPAHCSGYSADAKDVVRTALRKIQDIIPIVTTLDIQDVFFSHAGLTKGAFADYKRKLHNIPQISFIDYINSLSDVELWREQSPLWHRPTSTLKDTFNPHFLQVVGHTPVPTIKYDEDTNILYTDTWSTFSNRVPIGDGSLVLVDTVTKTWEVL